jgi:hypothetical protein
MRIRVLTHYRPQARNRLMPRSLGEAGCDREKNVSCVSQPHKDLTEHLVNLVMGVAQK